MKKVICIIALLLVASCVVPAVAKVDTQSARKSVKSSSEVLLNDKAKAEHICTEDEAQEIIRRFFTEYYGSIDDMAVRDELFRYAEDNEDTHLYIKYLDYAVNCAIELGTTKEDVIINNVEIKDYAVKDGGTVETVAYLSVNYKSSGDADYTSRGELWYISISGETTPKITSLQSSASEFYVPKDLTRKNKDNNIGRKDYTTFDAIDDAYATMISDIAILKELKTKAGTSGIDSEEPVDQDDESAEVTDTNTRSVSVPYNRVRARQFANMKGFDTNTLIFKRMNQNGDADCTNFVSQCLWIGYGGDKGKDWYIQSDVNDCQQYAYDNYRQISGETGWFGRSVISGYYDPTNSWRRVQGLYSYLSTTSNGPRANKYNNLAQYTNSTRVLREGDILQFAYSPYDSSYFHSVMVVVGGYSMQNGSQNIYVAQHSYDCGYRRLSEVIEDNDAPYVRIIHPITGSFSN